MESIIRVLIVEDSLDDSELMLIELRREGLNFTARRVETEAEMRSAFETDAWDVILSDYSLPQFGAITALGLAKSLAPHVPFIIVSGTVGEDRAVAAIRAGASDYVLKSALGRLGPAVIRELREAANRLRREQSEREAYRLAAVVQSSADAIIGKTMEGIITDWNPAAERLYGYSRDEVIGRSISLLISPDRQAELVQIMQALQRGEPIAPFETVRVRKGGSRVDVSVTISPVLSTEGKVIGASSFARDITEKRRSEQAIRDSEERLRRVVDSNMLGIAFWNDAGEISDANDACLRIVGFTREELKQGRLRWADLTPPEYRERDRHALEEIAACGTCRPFEKECLTKDGKRVPILHGAASVDSSGQERVAFFLDLTALKTAEGQLAENLALLETVLNNSPVGFAVIDRDLRYTRCNTSLAAMNGLRAADHVGRKVSEIVPDLWHELEPLFRSLLADGQPQPGFEISGKTAAEPGKTRHFLVSLYPVAVEGEVTSIGVVVVDLTERRQLEEQFRQAQKMEAIGRLAGGVAHDFNNLLSVINGYGEIILATLPASHPVVESAREITSAGERAASLTRQLLAFSRQSMLEPRVVDLNATVRSISNLLRRLIGEDILLTASLDPKLGLVRVDVAQLEQAIINLCVNARDAMTRGGKVTLETRNVEFDDAYADQHSEVQAGSYVLLAVSDDGHGMDAQTKARIFEPFFTTKERGKGTGLGLAMLFGFVKQSGGHIEVDSEPGRGATFKVYLPRTENGVVPRSPDERLGALPRGSETILIVEDEAPVRALARYALESCGYFVLEAADGRDAVEVARRHTAEIHLLATDVVMPHLGGRQVAEAVSALHPEVRVLYVSGYADDAVVRHGVLEANANFLQKPFTPSSLTHKVRDILG